MNSHAVVMVSKGSLPLISRRDARFHFVAFASFLQVDSRQHDPYERQEGDADEHPHAVAHASSWAIA